MGERIEKLENCSRDGGQRFGTNTFVGMKDVRPAQDLITNSGLGPTKKV